MIPGVCSCFKWQYYILSTLHQVHTTLHGQHTVGVAMMLKLDAVAIAVPVENRVTY